MKRMIETYQEQYDAAVKRFALIYLYITTIGILLAILIWWTSLIILFRFIMCILLTIQIAAISVVHNLNILAITKIYGLYTIVVMALMSPIAFLNIGSDYIVPHLWFITVPLTISVVRQGKNLLYWNIIAFSFMLIIFGLPITLKICEIDTLTVFVSSLYETVDPVKDDSYCLYKIAFIFSIFVLVCYSVYYKETLSKIKLAELNDKLSQSQNNDSELVKKIKTDEDDESKRYDKLYARIVEYMETNKPFMKKDFTLAQLSFALSVNPTYLSAAVNIKRNMNFSMFVNVYRIENVKQMIQFNAKKYTLEHIYLSSGFKNQSTFNKAFKQYEGVTPTEYIRDLGIKN